MFREASAFDQDIGWCVDNDVKFDPWGHGWTFQAMFSGTLCESTSAASQQKAAAAPMSDIGIRLAVAAWRRRAGRRTGHRDVGDGGDGHVDVV